MKIATYMCDYCSMAHEFPESEKKEKYLCPDCGHEMWYWTSSDIDEETDLVIENYTDKTREENNLKINIKPTPKCPICQSTNLSKISTTKKITKIAMFGVFGMGDNGKTWKCNNCGSKF